MLGLSCGTLSLLQHVSSELQHVGFGSLVRDGTQPLEVGAQCLSHWTTQEVSR